MGCDIDARVEYVSWFGPGDRRAVTHFARVDMPRDYLLFALLAGTRGKLDDGTRIDPVFPPRGLPQDITDETRTAATVRIDDDVAALEVDGYCTRAQAAEWCERGYSEYADGDTVPDPDRHSASWLTAAELSEVHRHYVQRGRQPDRTFEAVVAALGALDGDKPGSSRVVFWFRG
jgi:hypothetical protein